MQLAKYRFSGWLLGSVAAIALLMSALTPAGANQAGDIRWNTPAVNLAAAGFNPEFVVGADGTAVVAWVAAEGNNPLVGVAVREPGASSFGAATTVDMLESDAPRPGGYCCHPPQVAVSPTGEVTVVWQTGQSAESSMVRSMTRPVGSTSFSAPVRVSSGDANTSSHTPYAAYGPGGDLMVVWTDQPNYSAGGLEVVKAKTRASGSSSFVSVNGVFGANLSGNDSSTAGIAYLPNGDVSVLMLRMVDILSGEAHVEVTTKTAGNAAFTTVNTLTPVGAVGAFGEIVVSAAGATTVVWTDGLDAGAVVQSATRAAGSSTFGAPADLGAGARAVASYAPDGALTVAAMRGSDAVNDGGEVWVHTRAAGAASFASATKVSDPGTRASWVAIDTAADGTVLLGWHKVESTAGVIQTTTSPAGQTSYSTPQNISSPGQVSTCVADPGGEFQYQDWCGPVVAFDPSGKATAVWTTQPFGSGLITSATPGPVQAVTGSWVTAPPAPAPAPNPTTTPPPNADPEVTPKASLKVKALAKAKKLQVGKKSKLVRQIRSDAKVGVKVHCSIKGKKVKGKKGKKLCGIKTQKNKGRVLAKPRCNSKLTYTAKVTAKGPNVEKRTWQRTWKVKQKPQVACR
jgi:hypothetical protein